MTRGRGRHRLPRGLQCTPEGIGRGVEPEAMFLPVQHRQHRPDLGIAWRLFGRPLQSGPRGGVLCGNDALVIAKAAQERLIGSQLIERLETKRLAHAVRQDAYQSATVDTMRGTRSSCSANIASGLKARS